MPQFSFGTGAIWGERVDVTGSGIGPRQFGILQGVKLTWSYTDKPLFGQGQWPAAIGRGQGTVKGAAEAAQLNMLLVSDIFFGLTPTTGQFGVSQNEPGTVPASPTYTITPANAATYNDDLGVIYRASAKRFNRVTSPTAAAEYAVNFTTGVYTFSAADASQQVVISYTYNVTATGKKLTVTNQLQGFTPAFKATLYQNISPVVPGGGGSFQPTAIRLNACVGEEWTFDTKQQDWTIPNYAFQAYADASDTIAIISFVEQ
jgi:hypothetical protein